MLKCLLILTTRTVTKSENQDLKTHKVIKLLCYSHYCAGLHMLITMRHLAGFKCPSTMTLQMYTEYASLSVRATIFFI